MLDLKKAFRVARAMKGVTVESIAEQLDCTENNIYKSVAGDPKLSTIERLAYALDMKACELIALGED